MFNKFKPTLAIAIVVLIFGITGCAKSEYVESTYRVTVDYSRSLAEMIEAGKYDWVNAAITAEYFSIEGKGKHEIDVVLYRFNKKIKYNEVIAKMDKDGYRPATLEELLVLAEKYPDLQKRFFITAFGSVWQNSFGNRFVPYLFGYAAERGLNIECLDDEWDGYFRFAAVRK